MKLNRHKIVYDDQIELLDEANKNTQTLMNATGTDESQQQNAQELSGKDQPVGNAQTMNDYDPDNKSETETKSLSSVKSNGSNQDLR